jgi:hypothetical protein
LLELDLDGAYLIVQQETLPQFLHAIISKLSKIAGSKHLYIFAIFGNPQL